MEKIFHPVTGEEGFFATVGQVKTIQSICLYYLANTDKEIAHSIVGDEDLD